MCINCIYISVYIYICVYISVTSIDIKNHPQVYLEECKYKVKKTRMSGFITTELKSDSDSSDSSDSHLGSEKAWSKFDNKIRKILF